MLSILLINDNKIVSRLLQLSSKKSGFDIEESGVFAPQKEFYNLIFVDSDKYSDELLENIKENLTYDKLVFIGTAQAKKPDGFELVLEKPFLPTDFTALVEKNFLVDNKEEDQTEDDQVVDLDGDSDESIDDLLNSDEEVNLNEIDLDDETSTEDLAQMVDEIDKIDSENENTSNDTQEVQEDQSDDADIEKEKDMTDEDIDMSEEDLFEEESDDLGIDETLLEEEEEDKEEVDETPLPDIDDELDDENEETFELDDKKEEKVEEITTEEDANEEDGSDEAVDVESSIDELDSIDKQDMKNFLEPNKTEEAEEEDIEKEVEDIPESTEEILDEEKPSEDAKADSDIETIIKEKLQEVLTPELIKSALKDMKITISFEEK